MSHKWQFYAFICNYAAISKGFLDSSRWHKSLSVLLSRSVVLCYCLLSCVYIVCCLIVVRVFFVCCLIVVPLPPGVNPFAVNNNNNKKVDTVRAMPLMRLHSLRTVQWGFWLYFLAWILSSQLRCFKSIRTYDICRRRNQTDSSIWTELWFTCSMYFPSSC
jgi:hypothetical protein